MTDDQATGTERTRRAVLHQAVFAGVLAAGSATGVAGGRSGTASAATATTQQTAWSQLAKLTAADGDSRDLFGYSVALDGSTALVGALGDEDPNGEDAGSAYVFENDGGWSQIAKLAADDGDSRDSFGTSVALDGSTALVGALRDADPNGEDAGSAYVFEDDGEWSQAAKLTADDGDSGDDFGGSVALDGSTALLGAPSDEDPNGDEAGSAYVFEDDGGWSQVAKLTPDDGDRTDSFGLSVAVAGTTALVGGGQDNDPNRRFAGSAYVFKGDSTAPTNEPPSAAFEYTLPDINTFPTPEVGDTIAFDATPATDQDGSITTYNWDFDNDGTIDGRGSTIEHAYSTVGQTTPTLTVVDDDGARATARRTLTVAVPGRREHLTMARNIDTASVLSDIEALTGTDIDGALELGEDTVAALQQAVVNGNLDRATAEAALDRLALAEEVSYDVSREIGPAPEELDERYFTRQLARKLIELAVALLLIALSAGVVAAAGGGITGVAAAAFVAAVTDFVGYVLGQWLAQDSGGDDTYRQQAEQDARDGVTGIINDIQTGVISNPQGILGRIEDLVDDIVETGADGLRAVIELDAADVVAELAAPSVGGVLGAGTPLYRSVIDLNDAFSPDQLTNGLQGSMTAARSAVQTGRSNLFGVLSTVSEFINNLSALGGDLLSISENVFELLTGELSLETFLEFGASILTAAKGFAGAVLSAASVLVGAPLVGYIKTTHDDIVQSVIRGESVGFTNV